MLPTIPEVLRSRSDRRVWHGTRWLINGEMTEVVRVTYEPSFISVLLATTNSAVFRSIAYTASSLLDEGTYVGRGEDFWPLNNPDRELTLHTSRGSTYVGYVFRIEGTSVSVVGSHYQTITMNWEPFIRDCDLFGQPATPQPAPQPVPMPAAPPPIPTIWERLEKA